MKRALVICPLKPMYRVWPNQKNDWAQFRDLKVNLLHGKDKEKALHDLSADIYVINPEGTEWLFDSPENAAFIKEHFDVLIVDESTKYKNTQSQRFKRLRKFVKFFKRRYILTGSFTPKGLLDLFGQVFILDEGSALGAYVTHYKTRYFYPTDRLGYALAPHPWAAGEIATRIAPLTLVLEREGNIAMPELLPPNDIYVELPEAARTQYDNMEQNLLAILEQGLVTAANAAVSSSKCRQIANGFIFKNSAEGEWIDVHDAKLDALEDLIDQLSGEPLLVCYEFNPDLDKLKARFPDAKVLTTGNAKKDEEAITAFAAGLYTVGLAQISSIALGIDGLQRSCSNVCMYGITWNLEHYSQTIDRVWRPGQPSKYVSIHRIIARGTVDERVIKVLGKKDATQTDFLTLLRNMRKPIA